LGNGWYSQEQHGELDYGECKVFFFQKDFLINDILGPPRLLFSLSIKFDNGDEIQVVSDQTWTGRAGSIKHDSIYNGEFYDSRDDRPDWARPGFQDPLSTWIPPELMPSPLNTSANSSFVLQDMLPIRAGPDALHFEVNTDNQQKSYLTTEDIGQTQGANLTDGGILKPVAGWISRSSMFSVY
jgi:hypothetical protein